MIWIFINWRKPNKPFEWTGTHMLLAAPPQTSFLPLKGSVSPPSVIGGDIAAKPLLRGNTME